MDLKTKEQLLDAIATLKIEIDDHLNSEVNCYYMTPENDSFDENLSDQFRELGELFYKLTIHEDFHDIEII